MGRQMNDPASDIAACRQDMAAMAALWQAVAGRSAPRARVEAEAQVFNQMVVALDRRFGGDLAEGQVAREVRLLAQGVVRHGGWFPEVGGDGWRPDASVTGYQPGDRIALDAEVFGRLADVYLAQVAQGVER